MKAPFIFMNTDSEYFYIFPDVFFSKSGGAFIVNRKNKNVFFIGIFKNTEKEVLKKEIFNIFIFNETQRIEESKRMKLPVSNIFSMRKYYAEQIRKSRFYKNTEKAIFIK